LSDGVILLLAPGPAFTFANCLDSVLLCYTSFKLNLLVTNFFRSPTRTGLALVLLSLSEQPLPISTEFPAFAGFRAYSLFRSFLNRGSPYAAFLSKFPVPLSPLVSVLAGLNLLSPISFFMATNLCLFDGYLRLFSQSCSESIRSDLSPLFPPSPFPYSLFLLCPLFSYTSSPLILLSPPWRE